VTQELMPVPDLVREIVKNLVDFPDEVHVEVTASERTSILEICVNPRDVGKVLGKRGVNITAIRQLAHAAGGREKVRYVVDVHEPERY
jgi:uncharacterized protein